MGQCTPEMTIVYDELIVQYFDLLSLFYGRALRTEETVATKAIRTGLHGTGYESITGFTDAVLLLCPRGCGKRVKCFALLLPLLGHDCFPLHSDYSSRGNSAITIVNVRCLAKNFQTRNLSLGKVTANTNVPQISASCTSMTSITLNLVRRSQLEEYHASRLWRTTTAHICNMRTCQDF